MEFVKKAERFVELHKNILDANKLMKDAKKEKTILSKEILEYMTAHHMETHEHDGFAIVAKELAKKTKMSIEFIENMLENLIGDTLDEEKIQQIISALVESETSTDTKNVLSIKKMKEPKKPRGKKGASVDEDVDV
jgi:chromosomal replication initiation ATPase DnaA